MLKTDAIKEFLNLNAEADLAKLYSYDMEVHVNVNQDGGKKITGKTTSGISWWGFTDGVSTWKHFRIPWNAASEPTYNDSHLKYDIRHFDGIGMTGWDWKNQVSRWVGFDFDSIVSHKKGLTETELKAIQDKANEVPWVTARRSTSGAGLHLYVFLLAPVPTKTHTEHAALARAVLGWLSTHVGYRFDAQVDCCGGILWVWHRRKKNDGFKLIKQGTGLFDVPQNWKDHVPVIERKQPKIRFYGDTSVETIVNKTKFRAMGEAHLKLLGWFEQQKEKVMWWWDSDRHMLVCHTSDLKRAHKELNLQGVFETVAEGKEQGRDQNCFLFPMLSGWVCRRHTRGTQEAPTWETDASGWTKCTYDSPIDWEAACRISGGTVTKNNTYIFPLLSKATVALESLGIEIAIPPVFNTRPCEIEKTPDGKLILNVSKAKNDDWYPGWAPGRSEWTMLLRSNIGNTEAELPDEQVRHLVSNNEDAGWFFRGRDIWIAEPKSNIQLALSALGISKTESTTTLGQCVINYWTLVCEPFKPEYPGDRKWNRNAPQLSTSPKPGDYPTWSKILRHAGASLDATVQENDWCRAHSVSSGEDYLKLWVASVFQFPYEPLPYLFFYGPQNSGKSIFHEAVALLFLDSKGCTRVEHALINPSGFNAELLGTLVGVTEEVDLRRQKEAYNRIKDWVTAKRISIHEKGCTPYDIVNMCHFIQVANNVNFCPIFPGDTRIVVCRVNKPEVEIPKDKLLKDLQDEVPYFLHDIMTTQIPPTNGRLRIPVVSTQDKVTQELLSEEPVTIFYRRHMYPAAGYHITLDEAYAKYLATISPEQARFWTLKRFTSGLPDDALYGVRYGQTVIGNVSWTVEKTELPRLIRSGSALTTEAELLSGLSKKIEAHMLPGYGGPDHHG